MNAVHYNVKSNAHSDLLIAQQHKEIINCFKVCLHVYEV